MKYLDGNGLLHLWSKIKTWVNGRGFLTSSDIENKVDKEAGKGLSTNDYTDADKAKVATALQSETDPTVPSWAKAQTKPTYTASEVGAIPSTDKGANGGVATLDSSGKVPQSQLPSYVDDVLEYANRAQFPATGENGKIYVAIDTNKTYRWSGSAYVEIAQGLALGETSSTAFAGDRGKAIEDKIPANASSSNKLATVEDVEDVNLFVEQSSLTDQQRNTALANVSNQTANSTTGKMGYKVLNPTKTFAEQVTAENTIYEIRDVFDLGGTQETPVSVTLPAGSKIKFNGGIIRNCTIVGNNTSIEAGNTQIFDNVKFSGTFIGELNAIWVGAKQNNSSFDNAIIIQKWLTDYKVFNTLYFPTGQYWLLTPVSTSDSKRGMTIDGGNSTFSVNIPDVDDEGQFVISVSSKERFTIKDCTFSNTRKTSTYNISKTCLFNFNYAQLFHIDNIYANYFDIGIQLIDCWYGKISSPTILQNCRIGVRSLQGQSFEINTIEFDNVRFSGITSTAAKALYPQNDGETESAYDARVASCGYDFYTGLGAVNIINNVIEQCDYGIRLSWKKTSSAQGTEYAPLNIISSYFEGNRKAAVYIGANEQQWYGSGNNMFRCFQNTNITGCRFNYSSSDSNNNNVIVRDGTMVVKDSQPVKVSALNDSSFNTFVYVSGSYSIIECGGGSYVFGELNYNTRFADHTGTTSKSSFLIQTKQAIRDHYKSDMRIKDFSDVSYNELGNQFSINPNHFITSPTLRTTIDVKPLEFYDDSNSGVTFRRIEKPSGNNIALFTADSAFYLNAANCLRGIPLREFIRRWKAGTNYTGTVANLFPYSVIANPTEGTVRRTSDNFLVGFGNNYSGKTSLSTGYYTYVDALCIVRYSNSVTKFHCDMAQCAIFYSNFRGTIDSNTTFRCIGNSTQMNNVLKRLNAIYYNTSDSKLYIFNGYSWVELTNPLTRYYYVGYGDSIANRMAVAEYDGETYYNRATGITYTFGMVNLTTGAVQWVPSIGQVLSLEHPNGYTTTNNLDYTTELTAGEMVMYNGNLIKWNGTNFVNLDGTPLS